MNGPLNIKPCKNIRFCSAVYVNPLKLEIGNPLEGFLFLARIAIKYVVRIPVVGAVTLQGSQACLGAAAALQVVRGPPQPSAKK